MQPETGPARYTDRVRVAQAPETRSRRGQVAREMRNCVCVEFRDIH